MADTPYKSDLTRNWWTGTQADLDAHIELYRNEIDQSFQMQSMFKAMGLSEVVSVEGKSNTYRIDRLGGATVKGRKSGEDPESQRAINEKHLISVDTTLYNRHSFDYNDDWTAPSIVSNVATEQGIAHAKAYDQAHIIQLIKAGGWKAPTSLKDSGSFYDGILRPMSGFTGASDDEERADLIFRESKLAISDLVKRDLGSGLNEFLFLISPDWYAILLEHERLTQQAFQADSGTNDMVERRIAKLHGIPVVETPRLTGNAITNHPLGPEFNLTANEAKGQLILFHPRYTLVTVEAHGLRSFHWDDPKHYSHHLDTFTMFNVGLRRGDATAVIASN